MVLSKKLCCFLLVAPLLWGQQQNDVSIPKDSIGSITTLDEVVVVDSRFPMKRSQSGRPIIKINRVEIESFQGEELSTLVRNYSGIDILGSRTYAGQNKTFSIRGGRNRQVLILVDGVRVSDPARIDNDFELTFLSLDDVESIEIQKGAASTLYGSAAATGIINIVTKTTSDTFALNLRSSLGTAVTQNESQIAPNVYQNALRVRSSIKDIGFKFNASHRYADGMSAVVGEETDPFMRYALGFQLHNDRASKWNWSLGYDRSYIRSDYDNVFPVTDAPFKYTKALDRVSLSQDYKYKTGTLSLLAGYQKTDRDFQSDFPYATASENMSLDLFNKWVIADKAYMILGVQLQSNYADYDGFKKTSQRDGYFNMVYKFSEAFRVNSGIRLNHHSTYDTHFTYSVNPSYNIALANDKSLKLLASLSTAFIAPSLYQLYDPYSGNDILRPEENRSLEAGFTYDTKGFRTALLFFNRKESPSLIYDLATFRYGNATETAIYRGVEMEFGITLSKNAKVDLNYTFTETQGGDLRYLPKHALNVGLQYQLNPQTALLTNLQFIGDRYALDNATVLDAYTLFDLRFRYRFKNPKWSTFLSVTNLFDASYVEIENFATQGRNFLTGFTYSID